MKYLRHISCVAFLAFLAMTPAATPTGAETSTPPAGISSQDPQAATGRLRKLHLVRPDLIPYPIAYEIFC